VELSNIKRSLIGIIESDNFYKGVFLVVTGIVVGFLLSNVEMLKSAEFLKVMVPALVAIGAWFWNERSKLVWEQYKRKEDSYKELLRCLRGFHLSSNDKELQKQFLHQIDLLWMYAPDTVIRVTYNFLAQMADVNATEESKRSANGAVIEAIRKDLLENQPVIDSKLSASDYKFYSHIKPGNSNQGT
jgi:hypothetical protein